MDNALADEAGKRLAGHARQVTEDVVVVLAQQRGMPNRRKGLKVFSRIIGRGR